MFKNILIPTDGSVVSRKAIKAGIRLAKSLGAKVTGYYAMPLLQPAAFGDGDLIDKKVLTTLHRWRGPPVRHTSTRLRRQRWRLASITWG
jgi:nucleotide-binding universal stress UspA family protein